jgi:hypothetical protein
LFCGPVRIERLLLQLQMTLQVQGAVKHTEDEDIAVLLALVHEAVATIKKDPDAPV